MRKHSKVNRQHLSRFLRVSTFNCQLSTINCQLLTVIKSTKLFFLLLISFILHLHTSAQSVSASLDRDKILLGEQVTLQFSLAGVNERINFVTNWPQLKDTIAHTEILKRTAIDTINVQGVNTYQQNFTITSFDSGRWQLGPFVFILQDKTTGKQIQLVTVPVYLTVLPVDVSDLKDYHPIKDIIDVQTSFNWMPVIIAAIIILLAVIIFIIIKKRKKEIIAAPKIILKGTALERAIEKLYALEKEPLMSKTEIRKFHSEIDMITRQYFEEMMHIKALQLTTTELFSRTHVYMQDVQLRKKFQDVFEMNASVKFAKYMPQAEESKNTLKEIINGLQQIDESVNEARNNANRMVSKY
ncbi:MAG: hypothetical protein ABI405_12930 [Parafilimonas sp.]